MKNYSRDSKRNGIYESVRSGRRIISAFCFVVMLLVFSGGCFEPASAATNVTNSEIVAFAKEQLGKSYVGNTHGPDTFDCSGLVYYVFKNYGITLSTGASAYWNNPTNYGTVVSESNAIPGDVVSWSGHVGIYIGDGKVVNALNKKVGVVTTTIKNYTNSDGVVNPSHKYIRINGVTYTFTVTFNANGGSVSTSSKKVNWAGIYGTLPTPTRAGYAFTGWWTAASGGTKVTSSTKVNIHKNQTLYAQWEKAETLIRAYTNTSGINYLVGSDFATSLDSNSWASRDTSVAEISIDSQETRDGYNSLKIVNYSAGESSKDLQIWTTTQGNNDSNGYVGDDKSMILSFWGKSSASDTPIYFRWGYQTKYEYKSVTLQPYWQYFTIRMDKTPSCGQYLHPYVGKAGTVWLAKIQLEDGTTAHDFVPENGKEITVANQVGSYTLPADPVREGYRFVGWFTAAQGGTQVHNGDPVQSGNISIYAHWQQVGEEMTSGYDSVLPDGNYMIANAGDTSFFLDIEGVTVPAANGTNVQLYQTTTGDISDSDVWTITYSNGFYKIAQYGQAVSLDVAGGDTLLGNNVQVWGSNDSTSAQKWAISRNENNGYRLEAKCSGYSLDLVNGTLANSTNVRQWSDNNSNSQSWVLIPYKPSQPIPNGRYILLYTTDQSYELDVAGDTGNISDGTNVQLWSDTASSRYNSFDLTKLENGYYKIKHVASGKYLTVAGGSTAYGANVEVSADNGSNAQQWAIVSNGEGYSLISKANGYALDLPNAATGDGNNLTTYPRFGNDAQRWTFVQAEHTVQFDANGGSDAPSAQTKYYKTDLTLTDALPVKMGVRCIGWSKKPSAVSPDYLPGGVYALDKDITLYAIWAQPDAVLPEDLTKIEEEAFTGSGFTYVRIPSGVTEIGDRAFADCPYLRYIYIPPTTGIISTTAFSNTSEGLTIVGESGSYAEFYAQKNGYNFQEEESD